MGAPTTEKLSPFLKEKEANSKDSRELTPPPSYRVEGFEDNKHASALRKLELSPRIVNGINGSPAEPSNDECLAHLKFLTVLANLREEISETDGLFGIHDASTDAFGSDKKKALAKIREKRWGVYVARAVDRFENWFNTLPASDIGFGKGGSLQLQHIINGMCFKNLAVPDTGKFALTVRSMPPLDVLMVLHSFMLNPRCFLEDCLRHNKMSLWHNGFPWGQIDTCIDSETFDYTPDKESIARFESATSQSWDNVEDSPSKQVSCPSCNSTLVCPWTDGDMGPSIDRAFESGRGFADKWFRVDCQSCKITVTPGILGLMNFRRDIEHLLKLGLPLPGTILSIKGIPKKPDFLSERKSVLFANYLVLAGLGEELISLTDPKLLRDQSMTTVRNAFEQALKNLNLVRKAKNNPTASLTLEDNQQISIRRMMSRYWENSSAFGLDLVGAVLRQGVFVEKMKRIDWIHSPALESTITRLIEKYAVFFEIMAQNRGRVAVPTLDVDLAWHTHQLAPPAYYAYSLNKMEGEFVNHNDKIDETSLSAAFEWTSKRYQKITGGQLYSECTCWYCEAIRESHNNQARFLSSKQTTKAKARALDLHDRQDISSEPDKNPHISAHNAVRTPSLEGAKIAAKQQMKLENDYKRAVQKARKAGKTPPEKDDYAMAYVWGYPMYVPSYAPYTSDPGITSSMYSSNPTCMDLTIGGAGACVKGACEGLVSAGVCGCGNTAGQCLTDDSGTGCGGGCGGGGCGGGCGGGGSGGGC